MSNKSGFEIRADLLSQAQGILECNLHRKIQAVQEHNGYNPEDVKEEIAELVESVKSINGTLISVWHNDTFSNFGVWEGWKNVYEDMIKQIIYKDGNN